MSTTIDEIPARHTCTIQQGSPWTGIAVRFLLSSGEPYIQGGPIEPPPGYDGPDVQAQCRNDYIANGGTLLAQCDISEPDNEGWYTVSLTSAKTRDLPLTEVYIDIDAIPVGGTEHTVIMKVTATVEGEITLTDVEDGEGA